MGVLSPGNRECTIFSISLNELTALFLVVADIEVESRSRILMACGRIAMPAGNKTLVTIVRCNAMITSFGIVRNAVERMT